ncbi:MAG TPA: nucleotidyltransferase domain-containing protein [Methanosarcina sp.]|nr:nucleotidyltransferase domain-containing protein [Methanosarcina sp.]
MSSPSPIYQTIYQKSIQDLKSLVFETLNEENAIVLLFGSRARGDFSRVSDIDIGILLGNNFDRRKLVFLKEKIEDLNIPYTVDVVDLSRVSKIFKDKVLREGILWKG